MDPNAWFVPLGIGTLVAPFLLMLVLGAPGLIGRAWSEGAIVRLTQTAVVFGLLCSVAILVLMLVTGKRAVPIDLGAWVHLDRPHFHFSLLFGFDRLSVPFVIMTFVLCGTISAFAAKYLHREPGYYRFFVLFSFFLLGMVTASLAATVETLFAGWELVGLSSALLVAFYRERRSPVRNGLRVWGIYRVADAAFLVAAVALHHLTGQGSFFGLMAGDSWPYGTAQLAPNQAFFVGSLLLIAAAGKSALVPFSGWLPRAMEGPTPSSAIFYGALSVHLGAFLLLRFSPILELSPVLRVMVVVLGLGTAAFAAAAARVQADIKSALSFASLVQVGVIVAEIGFGFYYVALVHIIGHACLRTLQLLRAPSILRDYNTLENAIGHRLEGDAETGSGRTRAIFYRLAAERGFLDALLDRCIVDPLLTAFRRFDSLERRWTDLLAGRGSRQSDRIGLHADSLEDLA